MIQFTNSGLVQFLGELQKTDTFQGHHPSNLDVFGKHAHLPKFLQMCLFLAKNSFIYGVSLTPPQAYSVCHIGWRR